MQCYFGGHVIWIAELCREFVATVLRQSNSVWGWSQRVTFGIAPQSLYKPVALHVLFELFAAFEIPFHVCPKTKHWYIERPFCALLALRHNLPLSSGKRSGF